MFLQHFMLRKALFNKAQASVCHKKRGCLSPYIYIRVLCVILSFKSFHV